MKKNIITIIVCIGLISTIPMKSFAQSKYAYVVYYGVENGLTTAYFSNVIDVTTLDFNSVDKKRPDGYGEYTKKEIYAECAKIWFKRQYRGISSFDVDNNFRVWFKAKDDTYGCTYGNEETCFTYSKSKMESIRLDDIAANRVYKRKIVEL